MGKIWEEAINYRDIRWGSQLSTYLGIGPAKSESSFVRKQFAEAKHQTVDEREEKVDGRAAQESPDAWGLVENDWGA